MAEGGMFPWKRQAIDEHSGPAASNEHITAGPLLPPPRNMTWAHDPETREWRLVEQHADIVGVEVGVLDGDPSLDYTEYKIQPSDSFQRFCLLHKIAPTELRRVYCFSGTNINIPATHTHGTAAIPNANPANSDNGPKCFDSTGSTLPETLP